MNNSIISTDTKIGTINGTLLVLLYSIDAGEIFKSCLLAATGAAVSFTVSIFCKWIYGKIQQRRRR
ncbi:MAG: hypothetical protein ABI402_17515 [Ferruginibacter sp.]